jgi:fructosamine-3-kinase
MEKEQLARIAQILGKTLGRPVPIAGGINAGVFKVPVEGGEPVMAKTRTAGGALDREGAMLAYLAAHSTLPVPRVIHAEDRLLICTWLEGNNKLSGNAEAEAADHLAALHAIAAPQFGFEVDTLIGGLEQPNCWMDDWRQFFGEWRLMHMARECQRTGRLTNVAVRRVERLAGQLDKWIDATSKPALIHGDLWGGNVLCHQGHVTGFVDPAIYYADAEVELAFSTLFSTFGEAFFKRYSELRPIKPGFFEERRDLYNLYPLLVHVRLFAGPYVAQVEKTLDRFGC